MTLTLNLTGSLTLTQAQPPRSHPNPNPSPFTLHPNPNQDLKSFQETEPLPRELMWEIDRVHMRNRLPIFASTKVTHNPKPILNPRPHPRLDLHLLASAKVTTGCSQSNPNPNRQPWP